MPWATLLTLLLKMVAGLSEYLSRQQLLEAGKAEAVSAGLQIILDNLTKANDVKAELARNPDGSFAHGVRDKYTRPDE